LFDLQLLNPARLASSPSGSVTQEKDQPVTKSFLPVHKLVASVELDVSKPVALGLQHFAKMAVHVQHAGRAGALEQANLDVEL
jgi:hypothetical protein